MCDSLNVKWVDDMPEDLKALAAVVEEWPEHEYAVDVQVHDGGRVVGTDWNDNGKYHKEEWRAARNLMEVCPVETEAEEEAWEKMAAKQAA